MFNLICKIFQKPGSSHVNEIVVSRIPDELFKNLQKNNCTGVSHCFANCALAVLNFNLADRYVLCFAQRVGEAKVGHALIKVGGKYYDPTLGSQDITNVTYYAHTEFSAQGLRDFIKSSQNISVSNGGAQAYPPALLADGSIRCVQVDA